MSKKIKSPKYEWYTWIDRLNDGVIIIQDGVLKYVNKKMTKLLGYKFDEIINTSFVQYLHPLEQKKVAERYKRRMEGAKVAPIYDSIFLDKNKDPFYAEINAGIIDFEGAKADLVFVRDITQEKTIKEALVETENRFRLAANLTTDLIYEWNIQTDELLWFGDIDKALGYAKNKFPRTLQAWISRIHPEDLAKLKPIIKKQRSKGAKKIEVEYRIKNKKGEWLTWVDKGHITRDKSAKPLKQIGACIDITEERKYSDDLRMYKYMIDNSSHEIAIASPKGDIIYTNRSWEIGHGYKKREMIGQSLSMFHPKSELNNVTNYNKELIDKGKFSGEIIHKRKNGDEYVLLMNNFVLYDLKGEPQQLVAMATDVTEKKKQNEEIIRQKKLLDSISNSVKDAIFAKDLQSRYTFVNKSMEEWIGRYGDEVIGKTPNQVYSPKVAKVVVDVDSLSFQGKAVDQIVNLNLNGSTRMLHVLQGPLKDEKNKIVGITGVVRDITEERQQELAVQKEKEKAQQYLEVAPVIIMALDKNGRISMINRKGAEILGYSQDELVGQKWFECCLPEGTKKPVSKVFSSLMQGKSKLVEHYENPILTKSGEEKIISWHNTLIKDENGNSIGILSSGNDITLRKEVERKLRKHTEELEKINRLMIGREKLMAEMKQKLKKK